MKVNQTKCSSIYQSSTLQNLKLNFFQFICSAQQIRCMSVLSTQFQLVFRQIKSDKYIYRYEQYSSKFKQPTHITTHFSLVLFSFTHNHVTYFVLWNTKREVLKNIQAVIVYTVKCSDLGLGLELCKCNIGIKRSSEETRLQSCH